MSSFTQFDTSLKLEYLLDYSMQKDKDYWGLLDEFKFYSDNLLPGHRIWVIVHKGFVTDGASIPRLLWGFIPPLSRYGQAAVLHDYLRDVGTYYIEDDDINQQPEITAQMSVKQADEVFLEAMGVLKVNIIKRYLMYYAVRAWAILKNK